MSDKNSRLFKILDNYLIDTGALIGQGQYGNVYKGYAVNNYGRIFAVKETPLQAQYASEEVLYRKKQAAIREINSLKELQHPHIIRFINAKQTGKHLYLFMEYCEGGSLEAFVENCKPNEKKCLYLFSQLILAFRYLIKVIKRKHGDIKPANILLHNGNAKLADFGFSKRFVEEDDQCFSYTGSPLFTSPQILEGHAYTTKSEIWSLGITLYFMLCYDSTKRSNSFPWWGATDVHLAREIRSKPDIKFNREQEERLSPEVRNLLQRMLQVEEEKRIDWDELFANPLFSFELISEVIYDKYREEDEEEVDEEEAGDQVQGILNNQEELNKKHYFENSLASKQFQASYSFDNKRKVISVLDEPTYLIKQSPYKQGSDSTSTGSITYFTTNQGEINKQQQKEMQKQQQQQQQQMSSSSQSQSQPQSNQTTPFVRSTQSASGWKYSICSSKKVTSIDVIHSQAYRGNVCLQNIELGEQNCRMQNDIEEYIDQERQLSYFVFKTAKSFQEIFKHYSLFNPPGYIDQRLLFVLSKRSKVIAEELFQDIVLKRSVSLMKAAKPSISSLKQVEGETRSQQTGVIISKDHWKYYGKNLAMRTSYEEKLQSEQQIFNQNYFIFKDRLTRLVQEDPAPEIEDKQAISEEDEKNINLQYEMFAIGKALSFFLLILQRLVYKLQQPGNSLNEEDNKLLYLIEDLFMIYTFESTFRARALNKIQSPLDVQQFYFMRARTSPSVLLTRISQSYKQIFSVQ